MLNESVITTTTNNSVATNNSVYSLMTLEDLDIDGVMREMQQTHQQQSTTSINYLNKKFCSSFDGVIVPLTDESLTYSGNSSNGPFGKNGEFLKKTIKSKIFKFF